MALAKRSHFVGGLGLGRGFARGSWYTGGGSLANAPSGDDVVGRAYRALMRACVPSRASVLRYSSRLELFGGFKRGQLLQREPPTYL